MPNNPRPRRRSLRLPGYDYSQAGAYFVTACTQNRVVLFGEVIDGDVRLNEMGTIVQQIWDDLPTHYHGIDLDAFIVMPNHVHGIIILADESARRHAIPEIVRGFKTFSARRVNERAGKSGVLWQRGYYEHVIRNEKALDRIRAYIANNPARWADDPENISREGRFSNPPLQATRPYKPTRFLRCRPKGCAGFMRDRPRCI
jgi:putative transposase